MFQLTQLKIARHFNKLIKGSNLVADVLSIKFLEDDSSMLAISSPIINVVHQIKLYYSIYNKGQKLVENKMQDNYISDIYLQNGCFISRINRL